MPAHDPNYGVGRAVRAGVIALGLVAFTVPAIVTLSNLQAYAQAGTEDSDISAAFETLSRPQQARVLQRCKDVVARPAQADPNQLTICQMLLAMAKR